MCIRDRPEGEHDAGQEAAEGGYGEAAPGVQLSEDGEAGAFMTGKEILEGGGGVLEEQGHAGAEDADEDGPGEVLMGLRGAKAFEQLHPKAQQGGKALAGHGGKMVGSGLGGAPVSYTHLDVYKRQIQTWY